MRIKQVFQEAASCCAFCDENDVAALEIHHLDGDRINHSLENLMLVCSTCHSKITQGVILPAEAQLQKSIIQFKLKTKMSSQPELRQSVVVSHTQNSGIIANIVNIKGRKSPKLQYPPDSIGAETIKKGYIDYLYGKYIDYRKADTSFGAFIHARHFHPGELHRTIRSRFKAQTFFIHVARFNELVQYMQRRIDQTILGKRNRSKGEPNYDFFEDYRKDQSGSV